MTDIDGREIGFLDEDYQMKSLFLNACRET